MPTHPHGARGFTLAEVLVALFVASIALSGLLVVYSRSVQGLNVQDRFLTMQRQLRFAVENIKDDLRLAGFLATPNSVVDENICPQPATPLRAVTLTRGGCNNPNFGYVYLCGENQNIEPVSLTLFGDFTGGQLYKSASITGAVVTLQDDGTLPTTQTEWDTLFATNRYLKITNHDQFDMIISITNSSFMLKTLTLAEAPPLVSPPQMCGVEGFGIGYDVNVAYFIRYRVMQDPRTDAGVGDTVLVREELQSDGATAIDSSRMIIADNIVDLQFYDFVFDDDATATDPSLSTLNLISDVVNVAGEGMLGNTTTARPQDLRAMTVKLTSRTPDEDPDYPFSKRTSLFVPLTSYEIDASLVGATRCLSAATRIQMQSLTVRNLKAGGGV